MARLNKNVREMIYNLSGEVMRMRDRFGGEDVQVRLSALPLPFLVLLCGNIKLNIDN